MRSSSGSAEAQGRLSPSRPRSKKSKRRRSPTTSSRPLRGNASKTREYPPPLCDACRLSDPSGTDVLSCLHRLAARKSRQRKQGRLAQLEEENKALKSENEKLKGRVDELEKLTEALSL